MDNGILHGRILYSTCSYLAYKINKDYYGNVHYVWCTDRFDSDHQPNTSCPKGLCTRYLSAIKTLDDHDHIISDNVKGIKTGAKEKLKQGVITGKQKSEIFRLAKDADFDRFYPLLFLIDWASVKNRLVDPPPEKKASKTSIEYIIPDLKRNEFEIISYREIMHLLYNDID